MCLKSGAPGGLFTPTMTFGALLGGLLGEGWSYLAPTTSKDSYAIVGGWGNAGLGITRSDFFRSVHAGVDESHWCPDRTFVDRSCGCHTDGEETGSSLDLLNSGLTFLAGGLRGKGPSEPITVSLFFNTQRRETGRNSPD